MCTGPSMPVRTVQWMWTWQRDQVQPLPRLTSSLWNTVCAAIMCTSTYGVLALVSSLRHFKKTMNTTSMPWLFIWKQSNSSWSHPEGDNLHLPLLHQEQRGENWWSKWKMTALHRSLLRSESTMPADVLWQRHHGVGESQRTCN